MATASESSWVHPLTLAPSLFGGLSPPSPLPSSLVAAFTPLAILVLVAWLATSMLYWAHPGGPAWGVYYWRRSTSSFSSPSREGRVIPGPRGFPFLGSMGLASGLAHRRLAAATARHGAERLMAFSLGETRVVVASRPDVAKEILTSPAFADRPPTESAYGLLFHRSMGFAPHGAYWRALRRIAAAHLFSPRQVEAAAVHRSRIAADMAAALQQTAEGEVVQVRRVLRRASLFYIMRLVFGKEYGLCSAGKEIEELLRMVEEGYDLLGESNWSDHFPLLAGLDLQRIRSRCSELVPRVKRFVHPIIEEHRATAGARAAPDFVDILLSLQESEGLSDPDMAAVLWEMIFRGTDATAVLMEWTLARLVLHPDVQARVHGELDRVTGASSRPVTESDTPELAYLQAVIKEVLRLHPPGPLLSWQRLATSDTLVDGLLVPAGTTAMVNMWAIARDPEFWEAPLEFRPERFLMTSEKGGGGAASEVEFSVLGTDLRLAPFGAGSRSCPGKGLAMATVGLWVASLLHRFEWLPPEKRGVDLSEVLRLSCEMAAPLEVRVRPRGHGHA